MAGARRTVREGHRFGGNSLNTTPRPSLFFLAAAWKSLLENKEVVILLALFYAMITLLMPSPFRALIIGGEAASEALLSSPEAMAKAAPMILLAWLVLLVVSSLITVLLARLIVLGREAVLAGGAAALVRRSLKVVVRSLAAIFWIFLYALPGLVLVGLIAGVTGDALSAVLAVGLLIWVIVVAAGVIAAFYASVLSESIDRPLGVLEGWKALKGKQLDLAGSILILWVMMVILLAIAGPLVTGVSDIFMGTAAANVLNFVVTTVLSNVVTFGLMAGTFFVLGVTAPKLLAPAALGRIGGLEDD